MSGSVGELRSLLKQSPVEIEELDCDETTSYYRSSHGSEDGAPPLPRTDTLEPPDMPSPVFVPPERIPPIIGATKASARLNGVLQKLQLTSDCKYTEVVKGRFYATLHITQPERPDMLSFVVYSIYQDGIDYPSKKAAKDAASEQALAYLMSDAGVTAIGAHRYRGLTIGDAAEDEDEDTDNALPSQGEAHDIKAQNWIGRLNDYCQEKQFRYPDYRATQAANGWRCTVLVALSTLQKADTDVIELRGGVHTQQKLAKQSAARMAVQMLELRDRQ